MTATLPRTVTDLPRTVGGPLFGNPALGTFLRTAAIIDLQIDESAHAPDTVVPEHRHDSALLLFLLEGELVETYQGRVVTAGPGALLVRPAGSLHAARFVRRTRLFTIEPGPIWQSHAGIADVAALLPAAESASHLAPLVLKAYAAFTRLDSGRPALVALQGYIQALLAELVGRVELPTVPIWLRDARRHLELRLEDRFDLEALARQVTVHPVHLSRSFRRFYGVSATDFLRQCRVERAMTLLTTTDRPISEIATATGFADLSHLARAFRRLVGVTPAGFRSGIRQRAQTRP